MIQVKWSNKKYKVKLLKKKQLMIFKKFIRLNIKNKILVYNKPKLKFFREQKNFLRLIIKPII